jgi:phage shock protein A
MLRSLINALRGTKTGAAGAAADRSMHADHDRQLRERAACVAQLRKALAVAMAQIDREKAHRKRSADRIADLEASAGRALHGGEARRAREAAAAIAVLEAEVAVSDTALARVDQEIARLKDLLGGAQVQLADIGPARELFAASTLRDARSTLIRLRRRQEEIDQAAHVLADMDVSGDPSRLVERLAEAGFGPPLHASADAVLARINQRTADACRVNDRKP